MIRLSKSSISDLEKENVLRVLGEEYLGMGQEVKKFEEELSAFFGRDAVCVNTGTSALHLSFQAIGLKEGDEVLVPALTYLATFQAICATGAKPIPCDVTEGNLLLDLDDVKAKTNSNTKAICLVHYTGNVGDLEAYYEYAKKMNLRVIEDAAHALGTVYKNKLIGSFGDIVCFSFDGIKNLTAGEGGAIVTSDAAVLKKVRDARLLGVIGDTEKRFSGQRSWVFDVEEQGWRYHMSDVMAAIGRGQLQRFPDFKKKRQTLSQNYVRLIKSANLPVVFIEMDYDQVTPHIFVVKITNGKRDQLRDFLIDNGIQTGMHYYPSHRLTFIKKTSGTFKLPVTDKMYDMILTLPLHYDLTVENQEYIIKKMMEFSNEQ
ncbi:MAG: DegT/DnrJ/EryC1/StrS family aminotransferase [Bacteriovorax sp.]|nr:DegT/DnrJ/EryC1/StrS family aminotransferase [Bacteriovorax sp.]